MAPVRIATTRVPPEGGLACAQAGETKRALLLSADIGGA